MYSVIIVDDDQWALADIRSTFEFSKFGFELIAECTSAEEAYSFILRERPNLVITDICMDKDSGLNLIEKVKQVDSSISFIILSGHDHFLYAQKAVELGCLSYLLKPINREEAVETMKKATQVLLKSKAPTLLHEDLFTKIISFVDEHFQDKITINDVASSFYVSRGYIAELFRKRIGITFVDYREKIRIEQAMTLLETTEWPIGEISSYVGYDDVAYFSRVFKKRIQLSPQQYRNCKKHK